LAGAPGCRACGPPALPERLSAVPRPWSASTAGRWAPGGPGRRRRARESSQAGGWHGSRSGWRSRACGAASAASTRSSGSPVRSTRVSESTLGPLVSLVPGGPLVLVPVVRAADPPGLLRVPRPGPVPVPAVDRARRDAAGRHVGAADHRAPVDRRNRSYLLAELYASGTACCRRPGRAPGRPGNPSLVAADVTTVATPCLLQFGQVLAVLGASSCGRLGALRDQAADGTFAEALRAQCRPSGRARRPPPGCQRRVGPEVGPESRSTPTRKRPALHVRRDLRCRGW